MGQRTVTVIRLITSRIFNMFQLHFASGRGKLLFFQANDFIKATFYKTADIFRFSKLLTQLARLNVPLNHL